MSSDSVPDGVLARVPLLSSLPQSALSELAVASSLAIFAKGEVLFVEGDVSSRMFVVLSGRIRIFRNSARGAELVLSNAGPGESIGELSVIDRLPRSASAAALERSRVLVVQADRLREVLSRHPAAMLAMATQLAVTVRRLTGTTSDFIFLDLPHRLVKYLLSLVETRGGAPERNGATVVLPASQSGIAAQLGVTRQSLNQALGVLAQEGLIVVDGRAVRLLNLESLEGY
ncbi:MAG TPA: Crp/Fnr family transcriptional regulator [Galbitalea sp.]|nr:Crp/Fnr family transcriptional regulator [Galbitalea sp.]